MRRMPNTSLVLDAYQRQVIDDLALDAWYLVPIKREESDPDFQVSQQNIAQILEEITTEVVDSTPVFDTGSNLQNYSDNSTFVKKEASINLTEGLSEEANSEVTRVIEKVSEKITLAAPHIAVNRKNEKVLCLNPQLDLSRPIDTKIHFSMPKNIEAKSLDDISVAIGNVAHNVGVEGRELIVGQGPLNPELFIITPPPLSKNIQARQILDNDEQRLLNEILFSAQVPFESIYITPIVKQVVLRHQDPDDMLQSSYLPILLAEIALLKPKKILIMGRVASQIILDTKAPLRELIFSDYILSLNGIDYSVNILPSLEYFLKVPSEKYHLWQFIKKL